MEGKNPYLDYSPEAVFNRKIERDLDSYVNWVIENFKRREWVAMIRAYLTAERDLGRIAAGADIDTIGLTLTGSGHLLFADLFAEGNGAERAASAIEEMVASVLAGATAADRALCPSRGDDSP